MASTSAITSANTSFSAAFWDILEHTTGIKPKTRKRPQKMSRLNKMVTHRLDSNNASLRQDDLEYLEKELTMAHNELSTAALDMAAFDQHTNPNGKKKKDTKGSLDWSKDAVKLVRLAADELRLGKKGNIYSEEFLRGFFKSLQLKSMRISRIDPLCVDFNSLEELNLSRNKISILENLPSRLRVLNIYANQLSHVGFNRVFPNLIYAGLGYNQLGSITQLNSLMKGFPRLRILELSFNTICDLDGALECLSSLRQLSHLSLKGNPVTLLQHYRSHVLRVLTNLEELDDIDTEGHFSLIQTTPSDTVAPNVTFQFQIQNLIFGDDDGGDGKKKKKKKPKAKPKPKPKKGGKGKGKGKDKGKGKGKDKGKGKGKGKDKGKGKGKKGKKAKKGKDKHVEEELPETQIFYFVRIEMPGVEGATTQTPSILTEDDGSCSFPEPLVLELPPSSDLRDCVYFEGINVSLWSQVKTQPPTPEPDSDEEDDEDYEPPPTPAPIFSPLKLEGKFVIKVSQLLDPKWNFDRIIAKPPAKAPEEEDEGAAAKKKGGKKDHHKGAPAAAAAAVEVDEGADESIPKPKPNPIFIQQRSRLNRPAGRENPPEVPEEEEEPPPDGAPGGPVFMDMRLQVGEIVVVEAPPTAGEGEENE